MLKFRICLKLALCLTVAVAAQNTASAGENPTETALSKIAKMKVKPLIDKSRVPSTAEMAIYHAPIIMGTMMYGMMNFAFINLALVDISRRNK